MLLIIWVRYYSYTLIPHFGIFVTSLYTQPVCTGSLAALTRRHGIEICEDLNKITTLNHSASGRIGWIQNSIK